MAKKRYAPAVLVKVVLDHGQAVLAVCVVGAGTVKAGGGKLCRSSTNCSKATSSTSSAHS